MLFLPPPNCINFSKKKKKEKEKEKGSKYIINYFQEKDMHLYNPDHYLYF